MKIKKYFIFVVLLMLLLNPSNAVLSGNIDRSSIYKSIANIAERRQYIRFSVNDLKYPVVVYNNNNLAKINDISRGGISLQSGGNLCEGDNLPLRIQYKGLDIKTQGKVVFANENIVGVEFVHSDIKVANQILYLSVLLESDNNLLITRLKVPA